MFKLDLEKVEEPEIKLWTSSRSSKEQEISKKKKCLLLLYWLPKDFNCVDHNKLCKILKEMGYQTTWLASWEICEQVNKQQLEPDMEQQTDSKLGKEYIKAVYWHPAYLTYMQSTSC